MMDDRDEVIARLRGAGEPALLLDYDGTLVPIAATPAEAAPDAALAPLLRALAARLPLVAVVSGRTIANLRAFLGAIPRLSLIGTHGAEIAPAGREEIVPFDRARIEPRLEALRRAAQALADPARGTLLEDKGVSLSFHWRLAEPREGERRAAEFARLARDPLLAVISGKKVVEARPRGTDKGAACLALLREASAGDRLAAYFGDDTTDEDAFRALAPRGLTAVVAAEPRPSAARFRLRDPAAVREALRALLEPG
jgi:trehalose 6-phosphate phosphatase